MKAIDRFWRKVVKTETCSQVQAEARLDELKSFREAHNLGYVPAMGEFSGYYNTADIGSNWSEKELDRRIAALEHQVSVTDQSKEEPR